MAEEALLVSRIRTRVRRFLEREDTRELKSFVSAVHERGSRIALFGGAVRDLVLEQAPRYPRDVDLVLDCEDLNEFLPLLRHPILRRTRFGGFRTYMSGFLVDAWTVRGTWGFRHVNGMPSLNALPSTTFLNAEAIAVDLALSNTSNDVYDGGFLSAVANRTLEINLEQNPYPELCLVRSLHLARRTRFTLGRRLSDFIRRVFEETTYEALVTIQRQHYGKVVLPEVDLVAIRELFEASSGAVQLRQPSGWIQSTLPYHALALEGQGPPVNDLEKSAECCTGL